MNAIYVFNLQLQRNEFFSMQLQEWLGYSAAEIRELGDQVLSTLVHRDDLAAVVAHGESLRQCALGESRTLYYRIWSKSGAVAFYRSIDTCCRLDSEGLCEAVEGELSPVEMLQFDQRKQLEHALATGQMLLHYQPIVNLCSRQIVGYEALARWNRFGQWISPEEFIPMICGSDLEIQWLQSQINQIAARLSVFDALPSTQGRFISLNLSADILMSKHLEQLLTTNQIPSKRLPLEINENALATNAETRENLQRLHTLGHDLEMDDLGTGLDWLRWMVHPVSLLFWAVKLDRVLVSNCDRDSIVGDVAKALIAIAKGRGMTVIAEGVETEGEAAALCDWGCDLGQGWLFGRPEP